MGWVERKLKEKEIAPWKKLEETRPLIKQQADALLRELGYDPTELAFAVFAKGQGEEVWTVMYWYTPPKDYTEIIRDGGEIEVYLDNRGLVRRVAKFENGREQLLYGKDTRLKLGMIYQEVLDRLGDPNYKGPPPRNEQRLGDEVWMYQKSPEHTREIEVYFKDGKVAFFAY